VRGRGALARIAALLALGLPGCGSERPPPPALPSARAPLGPEQAAAARRTLAAWLDCEECTDGELEAVLALGPLVTPTLAATLLEGPSPAARELERRELLARHAELVERGRRPPGRPFDAPAREWVDAQLETTVARYQVRSAQALERVGGAEAERALAEALRLPLRPDVEPVVRAAYETVARGR
jgi:hypothetical protein